MQSPKISKLFILIAVIISGIVLVSIARKVAPVVKSPFDEGLASSSDSVLSGAIASSSQNSAFSAPRAEPSAEDQDIRATTTLRAPRGIIQVLIASSSAEREQGLSGRGILPTSTGMLFIFPSPGQFGFWMKDMTFPLDFVWIGAHKKVVSVMPGISPATYPSVFYPPSPVLYVLELDSGGAKQWGIATGTKLVF